MIPLHLHPEPIHKTTYSKNNTQKSLCKFAMNVQHSFSSVVYMTLTSSKTALCDSVGIKLKVGKVYSGRFAEM